MLKIFFNCTTNIVGGGIKNSAHFIKYALHDSSIDWNFAVSPQVKDILDRWKIYNKNIHVFDVSPARSLTQRKKLKELVQHENPDIIYTMAGPAYIDFNQFHMQGISNAYITHADIQSFVIGRSLKDIPKFVSLVLYQIYWARKADCWIFQTEEARNCFCRRLLISKKRARVISNAIGNEFVSHFQDTQWKLIDLDKRINIFCPAAAYPHKALHSIPQIIRRLQLRYKNDFQFILTLPSNSQIWSEIQKQCSQLNIEKFIQNIGPYNYTDAFKLFSESDIIFVPSILETFSASYLEAFSSKKPLVVADKGFAKDICKNAAIYLNPFNPKRAADKIFDLINDPDKQKRIITNGLKIVSDYGNQEMRYTQIVNCLKKYC
jgi:glycosyltransferase involved in cell wall biosynthesis